jgi:hypothetical protein
MNHFLGYEPVSGLSLHHYRGSEVTVADYLGGFVSINWRQRWWKLGMEMSQAPSLFEIENKCGNSVEHEARYQGRGWRDRLYNDAVKALMAAMS